MTFMKDKHTWLTQLICPLLAAFIWGTAFVAQDVSAEKIGPFSFNAIRYSIAVVTLLVIIGIRNHKEKPVIDKRKLVIGGLCCGLALGCASYLQQAGITAGTDAGKAAFITALYVVLVPVFSLVFLHKNTSKQIWLAMILAVTGLYLLCMKGSLHVSSGDFLLILCAAGFALHILIVDYFSKDCDALYLSCMQFVFAAVFSWIGSVCTETITYDSVYTCATPLLYTGIFSCGVAYTLQIVAQKKGNPTVVTILLSMESVFSVIASTILLHEQMSMREYLGCILMFTAVILAQIPYKHKA